MFGRIASCALVALAFAGLALLPASSSADVGPGGWGIADDFHVPSISLNSSFDELAPKSFRLIAAWEQLNDPGYRSQIQAKIAEANAAARVPGGMEIAVSFSVPPQTWQGVPLTGQAWMDQVAGTDGQIYRRFNEGGGWSGWGSLGGATISAPAADAPGANRIDVWARGTGGSTRSGSRRQAGPAGAPAGSRAPSRAGSPRTTRRARGTRPRTRASPARRPGSGRCRAR